MLTYICNVDCILIVLIDMLHNHLRCHALVSSHAKRIFLIPCLNLLLPLSSLFGSAHSFNLSSATLASATIGTSTTTFREIDAVSTSICTIFAFGANSFKSPVILSLNRVPIEKVNHTH